MATKKREQKGLSSQPASEAIYVRRTITIPPEMEAAIDSLVGRRKFSAFAQQAFSHELQRESIGRWLDEREASRNGRPLDDEAVQFAERAWRDRK